MDVDWTCHTATACSEAVQILLDEEDVLVSAVRNLLIKSRVVNNNIVTIVSVTNTDGEIVAMKAVYHTVVRETSKWTLSGDLERTPFSPSFIGFVISQLYLERGSINPHVPPVNLNYKRAILSTIGNKMGTPIPSRTAPYSAITRLIRLIENTYCKVNGLSPPVPQKKERMSSRLWAAQEAAIRDPTQRRLGFLTGCPLAPPASTSSSSSSPSEPSPGVKRPRPLDFDELDELVE